MNLLFVLNFYPAFGGIETVTGNLAAYLSRFHSIYTLSFRSDKDVSPASGIGSCFTFEGMSYYDNVRYFNELVEKQKIDCIINQGMVPGLTDIVFNPERNQTVKVISVLHGMPGYEKKQYWLQPRVAESACTVQIVRKLLSLLKLNLGFRRYVRPYRQSYMKCASEGDRIVLLAGGYKEDFLSMYGIRDYSDKICCISNPLSESYSSLREPDLKCKKKEVLYAGRISEEKRVHLILEVWMKARKKGWKLILVGEGPLREKLQSAFSEYADIEFAGYHSDLSSFYERADILLLTSAFEGFGMCLAEGMAHGVCPVAFDVGAGVMSVLSEGGGIAVKDGKTGDMSAIVSELMDDDELRHRQALLSYKKSKSYRFETVGQQWEDLINKVVKNL